MARVPPSGSKVVASFPRGLGKDLCCNVAFNFSQYLSCFECNKHYCVQTFCKDSPCILLCSPSHCLLGCPHGEWGLGVGWTLAWQCEYEQLSLGGHSVSQTVSQSVEHLILVWSVHNVGQWTRHFPLCSLVTVPIRLYDIGACNSDHLNDNIECSTEVPAYSDTFGTWEKCHCNQIVTVTRGSLVTNQSFGTCHKCHCKPGVTINSVTVSGEICITICILYNYFSPMECYLVNLILMSNKLYLKIKLAKRSSFLTPANMDPVVGPQTSPSLL